MKTNLKFSKEEPVEEIKYITFEVVGAGLIQITEEPHSLCGKACGFSFGVSWGKHNYCGGVIGRNEAKRMAEFMLARIAECEESEEDEAARKYREMVTPH